MPASLSTGMGAPERSQNFTLESLLDPARTAPSPSMNGGQGAGSVRRIHPRTTEGASCPSWNWLCWRPWSTGSSSGSSSGPSSPSPGPPLIEDRSRPDQGARVRALVRSWRRPSRSHPRSDLRTAGLGYPTTSAGWSSQVRNEARPVSTRRAAVSALPADRAGGLEGVPAHRVRGLDDSTDLGRQDVRTLVRVRDSLPEPPAQGQVERPVVVSGAHATPALLPLQRDRMSVCVTRSWTLAVPRQWLRAVGDLEEAERCADEVVRDRTGMRRPAGRCHREPALSAREPPRQLRI
ncbi:hypothetical protein NOZE110980_12880 [Nocardioides zeicaulis]